MKELIEAAEPDVTVVEFSSSESCTCPLAETLWLEYRERNPDGLAVPPLTSLNNIDPELFHTLAYGRLRRLQESLILHQTIEDEG